MRQIFNVCCKILILYIGLVLDRTIRVKQFQFREAWRHATMPVRFVKIGSVCDVLPTSALTYCQSYHQRHIFIVVGNSYIINKLKCRPRHLLSFFQGKYYQLTGLSPATLDMLIIVPEKHRPACSTASLCQWVPICTEPTYSLSEMFCLSLVLTTSRICEVGCLEVVLIHPTCCSSCHSRSGNPFTNMV